MFGFWLNRRLYENMPPLFFLIGVLVLIRSIFGIGSLTSLFFAISGFALLGASFLIVVYRNTNRERRFRLSQLWSFVTVKKADTHGGSF